MSCCSRDHAYFIQNSLLAPHQPANSNQDSCKVKPCEIPGSGVVLYYFKAQINGEISLPQSISQESGWLIRNHMFFPCFTMLHRLFSNMKVSDKNAVVLCVLCQND